MLRDVYSRPLTECDKAREREEHDAQNDKEQLAEPGVGNLGFENEFRIPVPILEILRIPEIPGILGLIVDPCAEQGEAV